MTELSDELLVAYVDGQLAKDQSRAVEKVLEQDDVVARRTAALQEAHERLEYAFDAILAGELRDLLPPQPAPEPAAKESRGVPKAAALVLALLFGAGGAAAAYLASPWLQTPPRSAAVKTAAVKPAPAPKTEPKPAPKIVQAPPPPVTWQDEAAKAQRLIGRESLEVSLESQKNPDLLAFQLTKEIGQNIHGPDLTDEGYSFVRAQMLQWQGKPLAQMLYLPKEGAPLSLFAMRGGADKAPVYSKAAGSGSVAWTQDQVSYLLAGDAPQAVLMLIAEKILKLPAITDQPLPPPLHKTEGEDSAAPVQSWEIERRSAAGAVSSGQATAGEAAAATAPNAAPQEALPDRSGDSGEVSSPVRKQSATAGEPTGDVPSIRAMPPEFMPN